MWTLEQQVAKRAASRRRPILLAQTIATFFGSARRGM
jgi:hypothetical protein